MEESAKSDPLLRTLAPALGKLEGALRGWLQADHHYPYSTLTWATLEGLATDLHRQAGALDVDRPLLVIMLMGGTGVGKSTLLNALAGGPIASASFARPTTRDPVVYYHESIKPERLDRALQECRLAPHNRPALEQKILVDTPDLDSNDLANRDKLLRLLPIADIVLYVGSQEKYHDKLGWDLFRQQRQRRAFAFVLNKWDRCMATSAVGVRPDEDLLRDLESEGFRGPLLFRTCAQAWVDRAHSNGNPASLPESGTPLSPLRGEGLGERGLPDGEQFPELVEWINHGLTRLEIEAIKARGISQMLNQLDRTLTSACPPDLTEKAERTKAGWEDHMREEAKSSAEILLSTLEPYQREVEHHFRVESQKRFRGIMASYLNFFTRAKYMSTSIRDYLPFVRKPPQGVETPSSWDLATFTRSCSKVAGERHLDARGRALSHRLLVEADNQGYPLNLLTQPVEAAAEVDWRQRYAQTLSEVLQEVEQQWAKPTGVRRVVQGVLVFLADWAPMVALLAALLVFLWRFFDPAGKGYQIHLFDVLLPLVVTLVVLLVLHILITLVLPLRWPVIRGEFQKQLERRLATELRSVYFPIPTDLADQILRERRHIEQYLGEVREVASWLHQREQAATIAGLYGGEEAKNF